MKLSHKFILKRIAHVVLHEKALNSGDFLTHGSEMQGEAVMTATEAAGL